MKILTVAFMLLFSIWTLPKLYYLYFRELIYLLLQISKAQG